MLASVAEQRAETATKRRPFAVNLNDVKATVAEILSQVGRFNFFNEFTPHNIRHVDEMLTMLEWVVPDPTARLMSPADWFMVVMAAYFHDLGLLVTKDEFAQRANSDFDIFCEQTLFSGDRGQDYRLRIAELAQPQRDEFLYQEFVRANHGKRIRTWIMNVRSPELGAATAAIDLIDGLLKNLDPLARRDLATVCESHTLSDLTDFKKYPVERPYDNSVDDTANLHYCALLLRTIDLLQITKDRAPTALFRIIDPSDPVSQAEWAKQNAVKRVKAKEPKTAGEEGARESQINTIEVFANFQSENSELNENGYFALTSYLSYAAKELALAHQMAQLAAVEHGSRCQFPWRFIDTTNVEAEGFLKEQFEFSIDQSRILDLLTGNTLYNNSLVVMRELVQNSLDAVRLYDRMIREDTSTREPVYVGKISILWDSELRLLQILDNGTGMSQEVIQNHLLKVGSSRYQDDSFKKSFPDFAPISRFGIGVLTAFMIADTVEIMTSETNDPKVRQISLRSVHGKYLIRLIDKEKLRREQPFPIHGTLVRLKLRRGVHTTDLLGALRQWIVIPGCAVTFCADRGAEISIGAPDAHTAMSNALVETGWPQRTLRDRIEVRTARQDGIEFAYPVSWSETFREWQLMRTNESIERRAALPLCCTCVQGIAVEFTTPGFRDQPIVAIANVFGPAAPRTNVARTALENTPESENLSACAYQTFKQAVLFEVERKRSEEGLSLTRATNEVSFIAYPLISIKSARNLEALRAVVNSIPVCMIEGRRDHNGRAPCTVRELQSLGEFWTVESETVRAAESLLGQFSSDTGIHDAVESLSGNRVSLPKPLLCNLSSLGHYFQQAFFSAFQVISIHSHENEQRVDFLWSQPTYDSWIDVVKVMEDTERTADSRARNALRTALRQRYPVEFPGGGPPLWFGLDGMKITGFLGCGGVRAYHRILLFPNEPVTPFMAGLLSANPSSTEAYAYSVILYRILRVPRTADAQAASRGIQQLEMEVPGLKLESKAEFLDALERSTLRIYDPLVWQQRAFSLDREDW